MTETAEAKPASGGLRVPRWIDKALLVVGLVLFGYVVSRYPLDDIESAVAGMWPGMLVVGLFGVSLHLAAIVRNAIVGARAT